jgi:hypothetical protein
MALSFYESLWKVSRMKLWELCFQQFAGRCGGGPENRFSNSLSGTKQSWKKVVEKYSGAMYRS